MGHKAYCCRASAGSTHILERFEIFWFDGSMVQWFNGSMVQSARWPISKCLAAAPVFLFRATRHFVLFSCEFKICAEVVVHRMFAVFLNSLNSKNSSRTIVRDIFSFFFFKMLGFKISCSEYFLSGQCKTQTADCRLRTADCRLRTRGKMQTESKTQAGCKMQNKDYRLFLNICAPSFPNRWNS